jgi:LL-H family phage holin
MGGWDMDEITMNLMQQALNVLLQVVVIGMLAGLVWLRKELKNYIVTHTTNREREIISEIGRTAFSYAEVVYRSQEGQEKLNLAMKYMIETLEKNGIKDVPMETIRAEIERAWLNDRRACGRHLPERDPKEKP